MNTNYIEIELALWTYLFCFVGLIGFFILVSIWREFAKPCTKYEKRLVKHKERLEMIPMYIGGSITFIPVLHPAKKVWKNICVERKQIITHPTTEI